MHTKGRWGAAVLTASPTANGALAAKAKVDHIAAESPRQYVGEDHPWPAGDVAVDNRGAVEQNRRRCCRGRGVRLEGRGAATSRSRCHPDRRGLESVVDREVDPVTGQPTLRQKAQRRQGAPPCTLLRRRAGVRAWRRGSGGGGVTEGRTGSETIAL